MAFATYDDLRVAIGDWLNRADLAAVIPTFISIAESYFDKNLRAREMWETVEITATDGAAPLPLDMAELITVRSLTRSGEPLEYLSPRETIAFDANQRQRLTNKYTIAGANLRLVSRLEGTEQIQVDYYARIPRLGAAQPSNWLLQRAPEMYLYGALVQAAPYLKDDARIQTWADLLQRSMDDLRVDDERAEFSGSTLRVQSRGFGG